MHRHTDRALIRHHAERIKDRVRTGYWNACFDDPRWQTPRMVGKIARTHQLCSGPCCGNQRAWYGPTVQERRLGKFDWREEVA